MPEGKVLQLFKRRNFFKNRKMKAEHGIRNLVRAQVLLDPAITVNNLRSRLICILQFQPMTRITFASGLPGQYRKPEEVEQDVEWFYTNRAVFTFEGSVELFLPWHGRLLSLFGEAEWYDKTLVRRYQQKLRTQEVIAERAELDLALMHRYVTEQQSSVEWYNDAVVPIVDHALTFYVPHIALWRQEGEIDQMRLESWRRRPRKASPAAEVPPTQLPHDTEEEDGSAALTDQAQVTAS